MANTKLLVLLGCIVLLCLVTPSHAFGAGNIASISKIEGHNWRHGDIEDMLEKVAFLKGHKWTSMMIKRVYFGNWLRDYSQAVVSCQKYVSDYCCNPLLTFSIGRWVC
jgi:catabolite regulation protein CreA